MDNKRTKPSIREKLQRAKEDIASEKKKKHDEPKPDPYIKAGMYLSGALLVIWASQFVFIAFEGAIKGFKKLRRAIREK